MRDTIGALMLLVAFPAAAAEGARLSDGVAVSVRCLDDAACRFHGSDMRVAIALRNTGAGPVTLPMAYFRKRGPSVLLTDLHSGRTLQLRTNPAGAAQRQTPDTVPSGGAAEFTWRIYASEIHAVATQSVDLTAEFSVNLDPGARAGRGDVIRHQIHIRDGRFEASPALDR